jgi:catechol 2,3-dioxygenase-like lactoylglutathione lyase family enzyme
MATPRLVEVTATLRAGDVMALAAWYRDKLGFAITMSWGEPAEYARVQRDGVELAIGRLDARFGPMSAYAIVTGIDALYAEFLARGVAMGREIGDQPYRMRDFDLFDPEGNRICFGEAMERAGQPAAHAAAVV